MSWVDLHQVSFNYLVAIAMHSVCCQAIPEQTGEAMHVQQPHGVGHVEEGSGAAKLEWGQCNWEWNYTAAVSTISIHDVLPMQGRSSMLAQPLSPRPPLCVCPCRERSSIPAQPLPLPTHLCVSMPV